MQQFKKSETQKQDENHQNNNFNLGFFTADSLKNTIWMDNVTSALLGLAGPYETSIDLLPSLSKTYSLKSFADALKYQSSNQQENSMLLESEQAFLFIHMKSSSVSSDTQIIHGYMHLVSKGVIDNIEHKSQSMILSNMTHEIRTPLNAIKGYAELVSETQLTDEQTAYVQNIKTTSIHLSKIVNDILDYSKLEAGKMHIDSKPFRLDKLLDEIQAMLIEQTRQKKLYLDIMNIDCPKIMIGDVYRIRQILVNLVGNAAKFTEIGGITLTAKVEKQIHTSRLMISFIVKDTGIGISETELHRIFQPFDQANASTSRLYGGTGLGLYVSIQLARLMDGDIKVESRINEGSVFILSIPLEFDPLSNHDGLTRERNPKAGSHILLVDDNPLNQKLSGRILTNLGMDVEVCINGYEAIKIMNQSRFDLIFMDIHMPVMDGYEATRIIRKSNTSIPIIAMSSDALYDDIESLQIAGMSDVIEKPIDPSSIMNVLSKWIPE